MLRDGRAGLLAVRWKACGMEISVHSAYSLPLCHAKISCVALSYKPVFALRPVFLFAFSLASTLHSTSDPQSDFSLCSGVSTFLLGVSLTNSRSRSIRLSLLLGSPSHRQFRHPPTTLARRPGSGNPSFGDWKYAKARRPRTICSQKHTVPARANSTGVVDVRRSIFISNLHPRRSPINQHW